MAPKPDRNKWAAKHRELVDAITDGLSFQPNATAAAPRVATTAARTSKQGGDNEASDADDFEPYLPAELIGLIGSYMNLYGLAHATVYDQFKQFPARAARPYERRVRSADDKDESDDEEDEDEAAAAAGGGVKLVRAKIRREETSKTPYDTAYPALPHWELLAAYRSVLDAAEAELWGRAMQRALPRAFVDRFGDGSNCPLTVPQAIELQRLLRRMRVLTASITFPQSQTTQATIQYTLTPLEPYTAKPTADSAAELYFAPESFAARGGGVGIRVKRKAIGESDSGDDEHATTLVGAPAPVAKAAEDQTTGAHHKRKRTQSRTVAAAAAAAVASTVALPVAVAGAAKSKSKSTASAAAAVAAVAAAPVAEVLHFFLEYFNDWNMQESSVEVKYRAEPDRNSSATAASAASSVVAARAAVEPRITVLSDTRVAPKAMHALIQRLGLTSVGAEEMSHFLRVMIPYHSSFSALLGARMWSQYFDLKSEPAPKHF